jgi:hypothetical protein
MAGGAQAEALARLGRRYPDQAEAISARLAQALEDPAFDEPDGVSGRAGHDFAFDGLWLLVAGEPPGGEKNRARSNLQRRSGWGPLRLHYQ